MIEKSGCEIINSMFYFSFGCFFALLSILLGTLLEHLLSASMSPKGIELMDTSAQYLFYSSIPLLIIGVSYRQFKWPKYIGGLFIVVTILFSGSLILYSLLNWKLLMYITPFGGVIMIISWSLLLRFGIQQYLKSH